MKMNRLPCFLLSLLFLGGYKLCYSLSLFLSLFAFPVGTLFAVLDLDADGGEFIPDLV